MEPYIPNGCRIRSIKVEKVAVIWLGSIAKLKPCVFTFEKLSNKPVHRKVTYLLYPFVLKVEINLLYE